jgi:SNF2 family DNA or RNA helicase
LPYAEIDGEKIVVSVEYRDRELIRQVPGVRWDTDRQAWTLPIAWGPCVQLRGVFGSDLKIGSALSCWSQQERAARINPCLDLRAAEDGDAMTVAANPGLYPFQRAGVDFMATAKRALNSDSMGLGKSVQTIRTLEKIGDGAYPALIVCPASMKFTWEVEFSRWASHRQVVVVDGTAAKRRKAIATADAEVVIINWESLRAHTRVCAYGSMTLTDSERQEKELNEVGWKTIVADEAHRAKDPHAKQTRALWYLGDRSEHVFALTGTPVANSPEDVWALMRFVSPTEYPVKSAWLERYAIQDWTPHGFREVIGLKAETREELFKILDPRFIRRTKEAVLPQLPEKTYARRTVDLGKKQREAYDQMREHMLAELEGGVLLATSPLTKLTRLLQFASAFGDLEEEQVTCPDCAGGGCARCSHLGYITKQHLLMTDPSCKVDALEEIASELGTQKAVVFTHSVQLARLCAARLEKLGYTHGSITGDIPAFTRQDAINRFQTGNLQFLVLTLGAGGEGITLTAAQTAIFLQRSFNLVQNKQAEDRIHRIGQEGNVTIIDVIARDTLESHVHDVFQEKEDMLQELVRDEATLKAWLS